MSIKYETVFVQPNAGAIDDLAPSLAGLSVELNVAVLRRNADGSREFVALFRSVVYAHEFAAEMTVKANLTPLSPLEAMKRAKSTIEFEYGKGSAKWLDDAIQAAERGGSL